MVVLLRVTNGTSITGVAMHVVRPVVTEFGCGGSCESAWGGSNVRTFLRPHGTLPCGLKSVLSSPMSFQSLWGSAVASIGGGASSDSFLSG